MINQFKARGVGVRGCDCLLFKNVEVLHSFLIRASLLRPPPVSSLFMCKCGELEKWISKRFWVLGFGFWVLGFGFRVLGFGF